MIKTLGPTRTPGKMAKTTKKAPRIEATEETSELLADKLEKISEMLEIAERIVEALKSGETVETLADANLNIEEAMDAARELLAFERGN